MKFRVIFLKKRYIYYPLLLVLVLIVAISIFTTKKAVQTFSVLSDNKIIKADLTGDGKTDILYIKTDKNKYYIEVNTEDKSLYLEPNKVINSVGTYYPFCPMKITLMDISRDKTPEIFVQSVQNNTNLQHAFMWNNNKFQDIFCSTNNLIGFFDCQNNRTPKFISGNLKDNTINLSYYLLVKDKLQSFQYDYKDTFMGKDTIMTFVKYIEGLPQGEADKPVDVYYPALGGKDLEMIGKLANENCIFSFQNATFMDVKWDSSGEASQINWTLNFKGTSVVDKNLIKNYSIILSLKPKSGSEEKYYYKITSMKLQQ